MEGEQRFDVSVGQGVLVFDGRRIWVEVEGEIVADLSEAFLTPMFSMQWDSPNYNNMPGRWIELSSAINPDRVRMVHRR